MKKVTKAAIPAAGLGTRVLPATKAQPKEMLVIVDKPSLQYIVEELVKSGITDIVIVTGRNKNSIEDHFDYSYELENTLQKDGKDELLEKIENHENSAKLDMSNFEVEHIMPQTSTSYWVKQAGVSDEDYTNLINTIGNLTLVTKSDNSAAGNRDFETKKRVFNDTLHIHMNKKLFEMNSWTSVDINNRSEEIISKLINMYPYLRSKKDYNYKENRKVYLNSQGVHAEGYLNEDNSLTIYVGSQFLVSEKIKGKVLEIRKKMLTNGDLQNIDGQLILKSEYTAAPSTAAELILGGSKNGWSYWKNNEGIPIGEVIR